VFGMGQPYGRKRAEIGIFIVKQYRGSRVSLGLYQPAGLTHEDF
jgi:hypothetical protein